MTRKKVGLSIHFFSFLSSPLEAVGNPHYKLLSSMLVSPNVQSSLKAFLRFTETSCKRFFWRGVCGEVSLLPRFISVIPAVSKTLKPVGQYTRRVGGGKEEQKAALCRSCDGGRIPCER